VPEGIGFCEKWTKTEEVRVRGVDRKIETIKGSAKR